MYKLKNWQKFLLVLSGIIITTSVFAAPVSNIFRNILPEASQTYDIGTSSPRWFHFYGQYATTTVQDITGAIFVGGTATSTGIATTTIVGGNATSTFTAGIRLSKGCFEMPGGTCLSSATGITSLNGLTGATQTFTNDTNVTISSAGSAHTLGWSGTLAAGRLNANVVQSIVNDTNVTGSISAQVLTLNWTSTLAVARGGTGLSTFGGTNRILYTSTADNLTSNANLIFDGTNLGIGTTTSGTILSVQGAANFKSSATSTIKP
jgi:hypothetical protein